MILALLLIAQAPGAELDAQIAELQRRSSSRYVITGSVADSFDAIQAECPTSWACPVTIAPGVYAVDRPIVLTRRFDVEAYGARLEWSQSSGLIMEHDGTTWRGGALVGATATTTLPRPVGVTMRGSLQALVDVTVNGFVQNIQIVCAANQPADLAALGFEWRGDATCNMWRLDRVTSSSALLDGVYVRGADANAGSAVGVHSFVNCKKAHQIVGPPDYADPDAGGRCANIYDQSFLGNTWVAPHSAHALADDGTRYFQYLSTASSAANVFVGPYAENGSSDGETGNGPSVLSGASHAVIGGLNNIQPVGGAFRLSTRGAMNRATFVASDGVMTLALGEGPGLGSVFALYPTGVSQRGEMRLVPVGNSVELEAARGSSEWVGRMYFGPDRERWGEWKANLRTLLPACTSTTGVTWSSPSGLVVRDDASGMSVCDGSE